MFFIGLNLLYQFSNSQQYQPIMNSSLITRHISDILQSDNDYL